MLSPSQKTSGFETIVVMGGQFVQLVLTFGTSMMIARILNAEGYGVVNLLKTLFVTVASIAPLGLDLALLKYCGKNAPDDPVFLATTRILRQIALGFSALLVLILSSAVYFTPLGAIYTYKHFNELFLITIIALPFAVDTAIQGALYKSNGQAAQYSYMTQYLQSFTRLSLVILAALFSPSLETIIWISTIQLIASSFALFVHRGVKQASPTLAAKPAKYEFKKSWSVKSWSQAKSVLSVSIWMCASLFAYGLMRTGDLMFLGAYSTAQNLGEYAALSTVAQLILFYPIAASQSLGPDVSRDFHAGHMGNLRDRLYNYTFSAAIVSGFVFGGVAIFGERLDLIFGSSFHFQPLVCFMIAFSQFISATLAPTGYALSMTGHHRAENIIILAGCGVLIALSILLVPSYGQVGAAAAALISVLSLNLVRFYAIKKTIGVWPFQLQSLFPPIIAVILAYVCHSFDNFMGGRTLIITFVSCLAYTVLYGIFCYFFFIQHSLKQKIHQRLKRMIS